MSLDELQEKCAEFEEYIQSTDVAAMQSTCFSFTQTPQLIYHRALEYFQSCQWEYNVYHRVSYYSLTSVSCIIDPNLSLHGYLWFDSWFALHGWASRCLVHEERTSYGPAFSSARHDLTQCLALCVSVCAL